MLANKSCNLTPLIRRAKPDDFKNVINVIEDVYGSHYANPLIYDKSYFIEKIFSEEMIMFIAESESHEALGLIAIYFQRWFKPSPVLGVYAVRSGYRGYGIGFCLAKHAVGFLHEARYPSTSGYCVTTESYGRIHFEKLGFICTGYLMSIQDNVKLKQSGIMKSLKNTISVHTLSGHIKAAGTIYIPDYLKAVTKKIYDTLPGITYAIETNGAPPLDRTIMDYYFDDYHQTIYIKLDYCGADLAKRIKAIENNYKNNPLCTVLVYLSVSNPTALQGCLELLSNNYKFSGYMPLKADGEYMILYNIMAVSSDFNELMVTPQMKNVLEEVIFIENR